MPRENIIVGRWRVSVGWNKDQEVQVATLNTDYSEESTEAGWFVGLTRADINCFIRLLRKARDGAYGADA